MGTKRGQGVGPDGGETSKKEKQVSPFKIRKKREKEGRKEKRKEGRKEGRKKGRKEDKTRQDKPP